MMEHFYYQEIYNIILNGNFKIPKSDIKNINTKLIKASMTAAP